MIEKAEVARRENLAPLGLASGSRLTNDVTAGAVLTYGDLELDESNTIVGLRRSQDALMGGNVLDGSRDRP